MAGMKAAHRSIQTLLASIATILLLVLLFGCQQPGVLEQAIIHYQQASTAPAITSLSVSGNQEIILTFNTSIEPSSLSLASIQIKDDAEQPLSISSVSLSETKATIRTAPQSQQFYHLTLEQVRSLNQIEAPQLTTTFSGDAIPTVVKVSAPAGSYNIYESITVSLETSEAVKVEGSPRLLLNSTGSGTTAIAEYLSGSGTHLLLFRYVVGSGHSSAGLDYISTASLDLHGGSIRDVTNNALNTTLPVVGSAQSISGSAAITITSVLPGSPVVSGTTPTLDTTPTWSWSSGGGTGIYRYKINDSDLSSGAVETSGTSFTPGAPLADGDYILYIQENDLGGNWSASSSFVIEVDTTPPILSFASVSNGEILVPPAATSPNLALNVLGQALDSNLDIASVVFSWKEDIAPAFTAEAISFTDGSNWHTDSPLSLSGTKNYLLKVTAADTLGNSSSLQITITVDASSEITLTNPVDGDTFVTNSIAFSGTAFDADGIQKIEILITAAGTTTTYNATDTAAWSYNASALPWNTPISVKARMTDNAANVMYSNTVTITAEKKLSFGETIANVPADESYTTPISYTDISNPVIIASVKPGSTGDGGVFKLDGGCNIISGGSSLDNGRYVDSGLDGNEEDFASAVPRIVIDGGNSRFQVKVMNTSPICGRSVTEDLWYLMVDANGAGNQHYTLSDGGELEAGNFSLNKDCYRGSGNCNLVGATTGYQRVNFLKSFNQIPLVFVQQISDNDPTYVNTKVTAVDTNGFFIAFQQDGGQVAHSANETFSYVAIELIDQTGGDPQHQSATGLFNGKRFQIGKIGMANGFNAWNEAGNAKSIFMAHTYTSPLFFVNMNTDSGGNASYARARTILLSDPTNGDRTTVEAYVEDTDSRSHAGEETFIYFIIESD